MRKSAFAMNISPNIPRTTSVSDSDKNILIVVHGMGAQARNSSTVGVASHVRAVMCARGDGAPGKEPTGTTSKFGQPYAEVEHGGKRWGFTEFWWAQQFNPPGDLKVAYWIGRHLIHHLSAMRTSLFRSYHDMSGAPDDPAEAVPASSQTGQRSRLRRYGGNTWRFTGLFFFIPITALLWLLINAFMIPVVALLLLLAAPTGSGTLDHWLKTLRRYPDWFERRADYVQRKMRWFQDRPHNDPFISRLYHSFMIPIYGVLITFLILLTIPLAIASVLLGYVILVPGVPAVISSIHQFLRTLAFDYLGDINMYLTDRVQAAQIRGGLQDLIEKHAADKQVKRIVLLAHSTGNLLVYDALADMESRRQSDTGLADIAKVKAFIGIGSILPMAWNDSITPSRDQRFRKPLPAGLHWYHLWTRFDIGPAGPARERAEKAGVNTKWLCDRRVNNSDDLLLDHTGYWGNEDQLYTLVLEEMGGLEPAENLFWRGKEKASDEHWYRRTAEAWNDFNLRRKSVSRLALSRITTWPVAVVAFPLFMWFNGWAKGIGSWLRLDDIAARVNFNWLDTSVNNPDLSVVSTVGLAGLIAAVLFAMSFIFFHMGYKQLVWGPNSRAAKTARDRKFRDWRKARDEASSDAVASASA